jgi:serine-type D-Ala-D-Ala carboxypeptidase/endopeptidase (penicillin-binding protein 4)
MLFALLSIGLSGTSGTAPISQRDVDLLATTVARVAKRFPMNTAQLGVVIEDARSGRRLVARLADVEFAPASNFKLLDAATALSYLGENFRFSTALVARGADEDGTLRGDLILVGGGDPVLSRDDLRQAVAAVSAAGIRSVAGTVLVDGSIFDGQRYGSGWAWDDMPFAYQPPIQALAVEEGTVSITVAAGARVGAPVTASLERDPGSMSVISTAVTSARK